MFFISAYIIMTTDGLSLTVHKINEMLYQCAKLPASLLLLLLLSLLSDFSVLKHFIMHPSGPQTAVQHYPTVEIQTQ